jgi:hypothetical protein
MWRMAVHAMDSCAWGAWMDAVDACSAMHAVDATLTPVAASLDGVFKVAHLRIKMVSHIKERGSSSAKEVVQLI